MSVLILAGGRGRRMGGEDKGLLDLAGRLLIEYALAGLDEYHGEIFISANRNRAAYESFAYPVVTDCIGEYWGPLAGMLSGLRAMHGEWLLVLAVDYPDLPRNLGARLLDAATHAGTRIALVRCGEQAHYTLCLLHASLADDMGAYLQSGGRSVKGWLEGKEFVWLEFEAGDARFLNLNSPDDLARFLDADGD